MRVVVVGEDRPVAFCTTIPVGTNIGWTTLLTTVIAMQRSRGAIARVELPVLGG